MNNKSIIQCRRNLWQCRRNLWQCRRNLWLTMTALGLCAVLSIAAMADANAIASGELLVAKGVTVNGVPASSGLTILSGSRIKTGLGGRVTVNLSKIGKVTLGPDSEMVLSFSDGLIGGQVFSGWTIISAPQGVRVSPATADGSILADGAKPSMVTIDVTSGSTRVESNGANVLAGNKKEFLAAGEELEFGRLAGSGELSFERRSTGNSENLVAAASSSVSLNLRSLFATGIRGSVEGLTLNHSWGMVGSTNRALDRSVKQPSSPDYMRLSSSSSPEVITCGDFGENCANCSILPDLVKAKAKCSIGFNVSFINVRADSVVSVRPFFNSACFMITPAYPQQVQIPPGGAYPFMLDARFCPNNAGQLPQNSQIVVESNTCGTRTVMVEWAPPCR